MVRQLYTVLVEGLPPHMKIAELQQLLRFQIRYSQANTLVPGHAAYSGIMYGEGLFVMDSVDKLDAFLRSFTTDIPGEASPLPLTFFPVGESIVHGSTLKSASFESFLKNNPTTSTLSTVCDFNDATQCQDTATSAGNLVRRLAFDEFHVTVTQEEQAQAQTRATTRTQGGSRRSRRRQNDQDKAAAAGADQSTAAQKSQDPAQQTQTAKSKPKKRKKNKQKAHQQQQQQQQQRQQATAEAQQKK